jgi:hypothetical protein
MPGRQEQQQVPGYDHGTDKVAKSPITLEEWEELKKSALFSEEDIVYLRLSEEVLADQVDDLLKTWRGVIFDHPHLRAYNEDPETHEVDSDYAKAVGKRFVSGYWRPPGPTSIRPGWTTSTRSVCATIARRRTRPTEATRLDTSALATCWRSARDCRLDEAIPRPQGPPDRGRQSHVRRLVEGDDPAGHAVESALHPQW